MNTCQTSIKPIYYCSVAEAPILAQPEKHETNKVGSQRTDEGCASQSDKH